MFLYYKNSFEIRGRIEKGKERCNINFYVDGIPAYSLVKKSVVTQHRPLNLLKNVYIKGDGQVYNTEYSMPKLIDIRSFTFVHSTVMVAHSALP